MNLAHSYEDFIALPRTPRPPSILIRTKAQAPQQVRPKTSGADWLLDEPKAAAADTASIGAALSVSDIERALTRIKLFRAYSDDWDGEGAARPIEELLDSAALLIGRLQPWHPKPLASVDYEGHPVIEFHDEETDLFGKLRIVTEHSVEVFACSGGVSKFLEGTLGTREVEEFLSNELQITLNQ